MKFRLYNHRSVCTLYISNYIVTKGKAAHLLKRSAKLLAERKPAKKYGSIIEDLQKDNEEEKEEDNMN